MEIWSFAELGVSLKPVRVEVGLIQGLSDIQITGLPDQVLRESLVRVKSALKNQGFSLPGSKKVLVNLSPSHIKKSGRGIELAIALGILIETEQIPAPKNVDRLYVYGELGLKGDVRFLEEVNWLPLDPDVKTLTGSTDGALVRDTFYINELVELYADWPTQRSEEVGRSVRPNLEKWKFTEAQAEVLALLAHGGHHALLAGPAGSGKSTLAGSLHALLPELEGQDLFELRKWNCHFHRGVDNWRPLQAPHHTATPQAILGGGNPPVAGEITRAHKGILLLDEFLEFPTRIREGLREPLEKGELQLSRQGHSEVLPADFQLVATTNLCPCGEYVPKVRRPPCRYSLTKCRSYLERLSGPLADRFDVMAYSNVWNQELDVPMDTIIGRIQRAQEFKKSRGQRKENRSLSWGELVGQLGRPTYLSYLPESGRSRRRQVALLKVARTLADFESSTSIELDHIRRALPFAWTPFESLKSAEL